ncbi:MAG: aromatic ring-hydroxylating oxygenase subunit alpha [Acidimicrobiales bacterium]
MRTLPAVDYHDVAVHERERQGVFGREWLSLGLATAVAEPGSFLAECVAGWPLLVVRDGDGELRGFHNVCRHRAGPLVDEPAGSRRSLVCRYHGWAYGLDGALLSARDSGLGAGDLEGLDLFPVRAATWRGLLFACLGEATPPLEDWLGGLTDACAAHPMESWAAGPRRVHAIDANWKTYGDNYLEGYHVPLVHPGLNRAIDASTYQVEVADGWARHRATPRDGARTTGTWLWKWPNLGLNLYEHGMSVERWYPTGPMSCELVLDHAYDLSHPEAAEACRLDVESSDVICGEDKVICESVQRNLTAGAYDVGVLSPRHEGGVADFHRRVLAVRAVARCP